MNVTDTRAVLVASLREHPALGESERLARERTLRFLETAPRPFDRHADRRHVTASAIVIGRRGTVLHVHRRSGLWLQPGGHVELGELPADAALRETEEETGLRCVHPGGAPRLVHVAVHETSHGHTHLDVRFAVLAPDAEPHPGTGESPTARWFDWEEALTVADASLGDALRRARREWTTES
jgi:8-oxo-dGTP pyrophosphatase MutT (NUDIX family)